MPSASKRKSVSVLPDSATFGRGNGAVERKAEVVLDDVDELFERLGLEGGAGELAQLLQIAAPFIMASWFQRAKLA